VSTATPRRLPPGGARGHGPMAGMGMPAEKSMSFGPSARRLIGRMRPERARVLTVLVLAVVSVSLTVLGPRILGRATDIIFAGVIGGRMQLPPSTSRAAAIEGIRASGKSDLADMLARIDWMPGRGIDFTALGHVLMLALGLYVAASMFGWAQGYLLNDVVQRTVFRLRSDVEDKLNRLPLPYFDRQPRGELLSRVTNDIDNIAQSLQQTMSQLLTSLLTVVGVVLMMFLISPLLSIIALVTIPLSVLVTQQIAKRSQKLFVAQWTHTGALNGQVEEAYSGHELVKVFGRQQEVEAAFAAKNEELYAASFGAQFVSGIIMPAMMFIGNLNYVAIAVVGGLRVASGSMSLGDVQAFIQYSRQFTQPLTQVASMANLLQSGVA
jgi:ATP-binding cassette, subfamily B, multidrug efflux pump